MLIYSYLGGKNMADCDHNCENCSVEGCGERLNPEDFLIKQNELSNIKHIIGVVSGKGGVGKSFVTSLLAITKNRKGKKVAILDADVTGPSIPKMFGLKGGLESDGQHIYPMKTKEGIAIVSTNFLLNDETDPIIWRGPLVANLVKQFYTDVAYGDVDYMFIDMPPGTGDVSLTIFQSIKMDGIIIVTSPQDLVTMIVEKAIKMAEEMNVPILGVVENYSYFECPSCHQKHYIFGQSKLEEIAQEKHLRILGKLPINSQYTKKADDGKFEEIDLNLELPL